MSTYAAISSPYSAIFTPHPDDPEETVQARGQEWVTEDYDDFGRDRRPDLIAAVEAAESTHFMTLVDDQTGRTWSLFKLYGNSLDMVVVGDQLLRTGRHMNACVLPVDRVTKTLVVCGPDRYMKSNGRAHGGGTWDGSVRIYTRDARKALDRGSAAARIYEAQQDTVERIRKRIVTVTAALKNYSPDKTVSAEMLENYRTNLTALKDLEKAVEAALAGPQDDAG